MERKGEEGVKEKSGRVGNRRALKRVEAFENRFIYGIYIYIYKTTRGGGEGQLDPLANIYFPCPTVIFLLSLEGAARNT